MPELSTGRENDSVIVPNVPVLAALAKVKTANVFVQTGLESILATTKPKEFTLRTINEYMFGYTDQFISMTPQIDPARVGLLAGRRGLSVDNLTIHTGLDSLENLGRIHAMNGETKMSIWGSEECNEIVGTDGSQFPPNLMDKEAELKVFIKGFCRALSLKFDREVTVLNGIPAWRYKSPAGAFASSRTNPDNKCYCDAELSDCPPDGVYDASKCVDGLPLMLSYPHFLEGDESLFEHFEGLNPNRKQHETFADIHPRMAFPIGGSSRIQMNFRVTSREFSLLFFSKYEFYKKLPKDLIIPLFWFEVTAGEIPPEFLKLVFHTTQTANATYLAIQYGSLVAAFVSLLLLVFTSYIYLIRLTGRSEEMLPTKDAVVMFSNVYPQLSIDNSKPSVSN